MRSPKLSVSMMVLLWMLNFANGLKILGIHPIGYKSHANFNSGVMKTLAEHGHQVTMISPFRKSENENYTHIDTSGQTEILINSIGVFDYTYTDTTVGVYKILNGERQACRDVMKLQEIQEAFNVKQKPFDVIFVETLTMYPCFMALAKRWNIPVIGTTTRPQWDYADYAIDNPRNPAYITNEITEPHFYESFYGRLMNTFNSLRRSYLWYFVVRPELRKFFEEHFDKNTLEKIDYDDYKPSLVFYNGHSSITPRPMNPNAIEIAGIHIREPEPLPKDIQNFVEESKHGVVLFSLGSVVKASSLSEQTRREILQAFAAIPQRVIWKFEEELENTPENVLIVRWLPQRDILAHRNVIAFISHCGLSSVYEAIHEGVPVISIPVYTDQNSNSRMLERNGAAYRLHKDLLTKENILKALNAVINDTSYAENMRKLSQRFKDRPLSPQQSILYWTEYVSKYDGALHLNTAATKLNWFQYLLLDVLLFVVISLILVLVTLKFILSSLFIALHECIEKKLSKMFTKFVEVKKLLMGTCKCVRNNSSNSVKKCN